MHQEEVEGERSNSESLGSSSSEEEEDPELEALLEQLSASEDDDVGVSSVPIGQNRPIRNAWGVHELPANNIAVLILGCWVLRIPVTFRDFTR